MPQTRETSYRVHSPTPTTSRRRQVEHKDIFIVMDKGLEIVKKPCLKHGHDNNW